MDEIKVNHNRPVRVFFGKASPNTPIESLGKLDPASYICSSGSFGKKIPEPTAAQKQAVLDAWEKVEGKSHG